MRTKKRNLMLLVAVFLGVASLMETKNILAVLSIQRAVAQTFDEQTSALINPPNSSVQFVVGANQSVTLYLKNNNTTRVSNEIDNNMNPVG